MELTSLKAFIEEVLEQEGYELYSLSFKKEMSDLVLEVIVDKDELIDLNMISELSEKISLKLDEVDLIEHEYVLNVCSLGVEKPLKVEKLDKYVGAFINLHLTNPINGENIYEGEIISVNDNKLVLAYRVKTRTKQIEVDLTNIYKVRLAIKF